MAIEPEEQGEPSTPLRHLTPWLLLALALSVSTMVLGAGRLDKLVTGLGAAGLGAVVLVTALAINVPVWRIAAGDASRPERIRSAIEGNVWLAAFTYAWAASALFAAYSLSDLSWRHFWQYGAGAALVAMSLALYAQSLHRLIVWRPPPLYLTGLHALAAGAGLVYLVGSGKLGTLKADWAANDIFLAGGLAIIAICVISAITQTRDVRA